MRRYARIRAGLCVTVVQQGDAPTIGGEWIDITGLQVGPGWAWSGSAWTAPAAQVPEAVTLAQLREKLIDDNLLDVADAGIAALPNNKPNRRLRNDWEHASAVARNGRLVAKLKDILSLNNNQLDALFIAAAAIE